MNNREKGDWGEQVAVEYLLKKSYRILNRNFRYGRGEIDIIARTADCVVFVEVKSGFAGPGGTVEARITPGKQRQLKRIAGHYIERHAPEDVDFRIDVIVVEGDASKHQIRHYESAFYLL